MKELKSCFWLFITACILSMSFTSCDKLDGEDDETYKTRKYIIGIGKWQSVKVKTYDGKWSTDPYGQGKSFTLEFFDQYNGTSKVKIWESFGITDIKLYERRQYEGTYVVKGNIVVATVNGQEFMRLQIKEQANNILSGYFNFPTFNLAFEAEMERTW